MSSISVDWVLLPYRFVDLYQIALVYRLRLLSNVLRAGVPRVSDANSASGGSNKLSSKLNRTAKHVKALH